MTALIAVCGQSLADSSTNNPFKSTISRYPTTPADWIIAKYGRLSTPSGRVDIRSAKDGDRFVPVWRESGGSPVQLNNNEGFGSKLIHVTANQLAAELSKEWKRSGLSIRGNGMDPALPAGAISVTSTLRPRP
jgi:hypothetical protein